MPLVACSQESPIIVVGAGGVGGYCVQVAHAFGANVVAIDVDDDRLTAIAVLGKSAKIIPTQLEFVDIAGLVRGASKGEGLGNQFLGHIREVDLLVHVVRGWPGGDPPIGGSPDGARAAEREHPPVEDIGQPSGGEHAGHGPGEVERAEDERRERVERLVASVGREQELAVLVEQSDVARVLGHRLAEERDR